MIALNELLNSRKNLENQYKKRGKNIDLSRFDGLNNMRKQIQKEAEELRAQNNKLCGTVGTMQLENKNTDELMSQISQNEKRIKSLQKSLEKVGAKIDKKLMKLPNKLIESNFFDFFDTPSESESTDIFDCIESNFKIERISNPNLKKLHKALIGRVFKESELPLSFNYADKKIIFFTTDETLKSHAQLIFKVLKANSKGLIRVPDVALENDSMATVKFVLKNNDCVYLNILGEFYTRDYKIKYKNSQLDMTKFVNEFSLTFETCK